MEEVFTIPIKSVNSSTIILFSFGISKSIRRSLFVTQVAPIGRAYRFSLKIFSLELYSTRGVIKVRFRISISLKKKEVLLPYDHQYYLAAYIYRTIEKVNPEYSLELHKPRKYKHFTFSYLMAKKRENIESKGVLIKDSSVYFFISSPDSKFLTAVVEGMLAYPEVKIKNVEGIVNEVRVLEQPKLDGKARFRTLSPIVIKKPTEIRIFEGKKKMNWKNLYPKDEEFLERLINNLKNRFTDYYGVDASDKDLKIKILNFKPKKHKIVNTYHRGALCDMIVEGDKDLIKYGYEAGFGEKNAMGFGMVRVVE